MNVLHLPSRSKPTARLVPYFYREANYCKKREQTELVRVLPNEAIISKAKLVGSVWLLQR
jgi:hypothetical protein